MFVILEITEMAQTVVYDIAIIGGGVVGCAVLHELTNQGYRCILLEKEGDLVTGASSGNRYILYLYIDITIRLSTI